MARKAVLGLLEIQEKHEGIFKGCAKGKNAKKTFPGSERKAKGILEIIHSDVCGPMYSSLLSMYAYYVSFIDDLSCNIWIYFLKEKSEVFKKLKDYKALVENQKDRKIKILQSDNGGEFTLEEFKEICRESKIKRELSTPYNPQWNGVAE